MASDVQEIPTSIKNKQGHKSTLLLMNKCVDTHINMKTQCLKTNRT